MSKKSIQSCYVEPAKSDIPASSFAKFVFVKYHQQMKHWYGKHDADLSIPNGWVWSPDNVDEKGANDKYLQMPVILLAVQCLHAMYKDQLKFDVYQRLIQVLCYQMYKDDQKVQHKVDDQEDQDIDVKQNDFEKNNVIHTKPVTARLIKYMLYNNGAGNAGKITVGDYGFVKPFWTHPVTKTKSQYNQYCRVRGVKSIDDCWVIYFVYEIFMCDVWFVSLYILVD